MRKHLIIVTIAALGALVCSCEREKDINTPGEIGKNTLAFTLKTSGAETRSMDTAPAVQRGAIIPLETTEDGLSFFLEETIASLDDETFFVPVETIGTPVYTENFETMSGGSFRGAGFLDQQMTNGKITNAVYPNGGWADFTKKNEFWEHSYDWDPWYDRDALLFYGALFTEEEKTAANRAALGFAAEKGMIAAIPDGSPAAREPISRAATVLPRPRRTSRISSSPPARLPSRKPRKPFLSFSTML